MKTNASLGDLTGLCKLFGGLKGNQMHEESSRQRTAAAAGMNALNGTLG
jgi:hypothetical protein